MLPKHTPFPVEHSHSRIIEQMKKLGFKSNAGGVCHGLALMCMQAMLAGEEDIFLERISLICKTDDLATKVADAQAKARKRQKLSDEDQKYLDVLAFFNGVELYFQPSEYRELFDQKMVQFSMFEVANYLIPEKVMKDEKDEKAKHKIAEVYRDIGIFNKQELEDYLNQLVKLLQIQKSPTPLPIYLASLNHAICMRYDNKKKCWRFSDSNNPSLIMDVKHENLAGHIMKSFGEPKMTAFCIAVASTSANPKLEAMQKEMLDFRMQRAIPVEVASRVSDRGYSLTGLAIDMGVTDIFRKLPPLPVNPNRMVGKAHNKPAYFDAALQGNFTVIHEMKKQGDDLNQQLDRRYLPAYAVYAPNMDLIHKLNQIGIGFDTVPNYVSPLEEAFRNQNWNAAISVLFAKKRYNLAIKIRYKYTYKASDLAWSFIKYFERVNPTAADINLEAIAELRMLGVNFNLSCFEHKTPLATLVRLKLWDVVAAVLSEVDKIADIQNQVAELLKNSKAELEIAIKNLVNKKHQSLYRCVFGTNALTDLIGKERVFEIISSKENLLNSYRSMSGNPIAYGELLDDEEHRKEIKTLTMHIIGAVNTYLANYPKETKKEFQQQQAMNLFNECQFMTVMLKGKESSIVDKYHAYYSFLQCIKLNFVSLPDGELKKLLSLNGGALDSIAKCVAHLLNVKTNPKVTATEVKAKLEDYLEKAEALLQKEIDLLCPPEEKNSSQDDEVKADDVPNIIPRKPSLPAQNFPSPPQMPMPPVAPVPQPTKKLTRACTDAIFKEISNYISSRTDYSLRELNWTTKLFRNKKLTQEKINKLEEFRDLLQKESDQTKILAKLNAVKLETNKLEADAHKNRCCFFSSNLTPRLDKIEQIIMRHSLN